MIEFLERRLLQALTEIFNGVLKVQGYPGGEYIDVQVGTEKTVLTYLGAYQQFATSAYTSMEIRGGTDGDWINVEGTFSRPALIDGGGGNDTIGGSLQIETLRGGAGDDVIYYQFGDLIDPQDAGSNTFF